MIEVFTGIVLVLSFAFLTYLMLRPLHNDSFEVDYAAKWFTKHTFCEKCGGLMGWYARDTGEFYDTETGRAYFSVTWACENESEFNRHTYFTLVEWCQRRIYNDEV